MTATAGAPIAELGSAEELVLASVPKGLLIGGSWRPAADGSTFEVEDPATGEVLARVADAAVADALDALAAADSAFQAFRATSPRERASLLREAHALVKASKEQLALLITLEMGKPLDEARAEVEYANDFLLWYAEEAVRVNGRYTRNPSGAGDILTTREPVGPCLFVTPWNFPLAMATRKLAPALAVGCTAVLKPAEQSPLTALAFAAILDAAGLPAGCVNVVTTTSAPAVVGTLMRDSRLRKISFTGSTEVGKTLIRQSAERVLRVSMELGGNAPFVVFEDADLDAAVEGAMLAKMRNGGEACTSANRFYVHEAVAEPFIERLTERVAALEVGRGTDPGATLGPLIDGAQRDKVASLVDDATERGARVALAGGPVDGPGYFYAPTVLADVPEDARLLHEEIFGPVVAIRTFRTEDQAVAAANATEYGLVAYIYTRDGERARRVANRIETGMVGVNRGLVSNVAAPFGGVKESGFGREGGPEGIDDYLVTKYIAGNGV